MKKWQNVRPFVGALLLLTIGNGDWVLVPLVMLTVGSFWSQFVILAILLNIELVGWYKFWRWFFISFLPERKKVKTTINFTKEITTELKHKGIINRIVDFFEDQFEWAVRPDRWLIKAMKTSGHFMMLFLGFEPFMTGGRVAGVIFCVTTGFKNGLYSLMAGNCVHVLISMGSWNLVFYIWSQYRGFVILAILILVLFLVRGYVWEKLERKQGQPKSS